MPQHGAEPSLSASLSSTPRGLPAGVHTFTSDAQRKVGTLESDALLLLCRVVLCRVVCCVGVGVSCRRSVFSSCPFCCLFWWSLASCRHASLKNERFFKMHQK